MGKRYGRNKGPRRSGMKRFSQAYINTGRGPNKAVLSEYMKRTRSLRYAPGELMPINVGPPKQEIINKGVNYDPNYIDGVKRTERVIVCSWPPGVRVEMFYAKHEYYLVETETREYYTRRTSGVYRTREELMSAYTRDIVIWIRTEHLDPDKVHS